MIYPKSKVTVTALTVTTEITEEDEGYPRTLEVRLHDDESPGLISITDKMRARITGLGDLLAVIHRDGGHYQAEHGTAKAIENAIAAVHSLRAQVCAVDELAMLVRRLAHTLQKSAPDSGLPKTAMDYLKIAGLDGLPMRLVGDA